MDVAELSHEGFPHYSLAPFFEELCADCKFFRNLSMSPSPGAHRAACALACCHELATRLTSKRRFTVLPRRPYNSSHALDPRHQTWIRQLRPESILPEPFVLLPCGCGCSVPSSSVRRAQQCFEPLPLERPTPIPKSVKVRFSA